MPATTTAPSTATTKRRSLPTHLLSGRAHGPDAGRAPPPTAAAARRSRTAPYTTVTETFDDAFDDDDGIPLMPLTRVQSAWQPAPPPAVAAAYDDELDGKKGKGKGRRGGAAKRRVYRYVSHGIGGAGNFRKFFFSFAFFLVMGALFGGGDGCVCVCVCVVLDVYVCVQV